MATATAAVTKKIGTMAPFRFLLSLHDRWDEQWLINKWSSKRRGWTWFFLLSHRNVEYIPALEFKAGNYPRCRCGRRHKFYHFEAAHRLRFKLHNSNKCIAKVK